MPTVLVNVRVDSKTLEILRTIASGRGEKYLSAIIREALTEYVRTYTGEPTLKGLQTRISEMEIRLRKIEDTLMKDSK
ncbi:MAG: ribbon-helix-helix protein, CopG family [Candidatus Bathyarchaeota archaeon]|nr:ribbon-helix-helix protein, CopG family [Candidatus Bathyarchaeota archaeon]